MSFRADNEAYEAWLRKQCNVVEADLERKHERMRKSPFDFLRATCFRWARKIEKICPELKNAPTVLSVGDAHLENFGTWRDAEGRLVWGINDFDDAAEIPYPYDLVRLAVSARLAAPEGVERRAIASKILEGYRKGLAAPHPTLLDEQQTWMRPLVACSDKDRERFWQEVDGYPGATPPPDAAAGLLGHLPEGARVLRYASRVKGGGSLGRPRYLAIAAWRGGRVVREAKALVPSSWDWAHGADTAPLRFLELANGAFRAPDPWLGRAGAFIVRRVAADARKVELSDDRPFSGDLLDAMGCDIGAIHAADRRSAAIPADLDKLPPDWLHVAAKSAAAAVQRDYDEWTK